MAQQSSYELVTPYLDIEPQDMEVDATLSTPPGQAPTTALMAGEWLSFDSSYKGVRAHTLSDPCEAMAWAAYFDQGDVSVQALYHIPILLGHGGYMVDTMVSQDGVGGFSFALNAPVAIGAVDIGDGVSRSGLIPWDAATMDGTSVRKVGYILKLGTWDGSGYPLTPMRVFITVS